MAAAGVGIWAPGENPGTHEEALAAVKLALEAGGGDVNDIDEERRDGAARRGLSRRRDPGDPVPDRQGRQARRREQEGMDAADRRRRRRVHAGRAQALSGGRRAPSQAMRARGLPVPRSTQPASDAAGGAGRRPPRPRGDAPTTIWDGVFTEAQAARGQARYAQACATCHADDLLGELERPGAGRPAVLRRAGRIHRATRCVQAIRQTMPQEAPDSLGTRPTSISSAIC